MKTIEFINVLGTVYSVSLGQLEDTRNDGECDCELKTIIIGMHLSEERMKRVMMHELLHAALFECGVCEYVDHQAEEMICQSLSGFLNGILNWTIKTEPNKTFCS